MNPLSPLTGGHWESLSAAIICTFRCLLWDFPLDLISLWSTWEKGKDEVKGQEHEWGSQNPSKLLMSVVIYSTFGEETFT